MKQQDRYCIRMITFFVNKMNVAILDHCAVLVKKVELLFLGAPVVGIHPVLYKFFQVVKTYSMFPPAIVQVFDPARAFKPVPEISQDIFRNMNVERVNSNFFCYFSFHNFTGSFAETKEKIMP